MKTRKEQWRNAAYEYILMNGPSTATILIEMVKQKNGRDFKNRGASHVNQATQLLRVDKRFESRLIRSNASLDSATSYLICEWSVIRNEE